MKASILHIDDEQLTDELAQTLRGHGYQLTESDDRDESLRMVQDRKVDLVISEIQLTRCDGLELLQEIRACDDKLPILVVTVLDRTPELYSEILELGITDFLTKPVLDTQLLNTIVELIGGKRDSADRGGGDEIPDSTVRDTGDLGKLPITELFRRFYLGGVAGVCIVSSDRKRMGIQLRNGSIVAIGVNGGHESLENYLLRIDRVTPRQHEALLDQVTAGFGTIRESLLGMGILSEDELARAECGLAEEQLSEVFAWSTGSFRFLSGKTLKAGSTIKCDLPVRALLLREGLNEADSERASGSLAKRDPLYVSSSEPLDAALASEIDTPALKILATFNGDRTVSEILATDEIKTHTLYGFWLAGIVEFHSDPILVLDEVLAEPSGTAVREVALTPPRRSKAAPPKALQDRLAGLHNRVHSQNDFALLGVEESVNDEEVRSAREQLLELLPTAAEVAPFPQLVSSLKKIHLRIEKAYDHLETAGSRLAYAALRREEEKDRETNAIGERAREAEDWFRKGEQAMKKEDYDQAVEAFGMATHHSPEIGDYLAHLGYAMYRANPDEKLVMREAMEHIAKGIKLSPGHQQPYLYLARIFKQSGDLTSARKVYRQANRIAPDCIEALRELRLIEQREHKRQKPKGIMGLLRKG